MKVLFYSPFANIWEHSFPEGLVAESFAKHSVEVKAVRCDGMLQVHCVAMSAAGVGPDASLSTRLQVCRACVKRRDLITKEMGIPALIMDRWLSASLMARVDELIAGAQRESWTDLEVDGVPLGRYAAYETWINNKLVSTDLEDSVWAQYLGQLRNTLMVYFAAQQILATEQPDAVIVYNDHYSVNHAFCAAAQRVGIPTYTIHGGHHMVRRAETLSIFTSNHTMEDVFQSAAWKAYQQNPISDTEVDLVGGHLSGLLAANSAFVYSSEFKGTGPEELRKTLGIAEGSNVLLATMSSEDELMAVRLIDAIPSTLTQKSLFANQFEWVDYLFGYARAHPEVHLVLRLHPRMFPNKRESMVSPVVGKILALRDTAPKNVTFNMPADGIGLYDVMQIVDVLLNFRSSVGAELAAVGIPVVVPSNSDFYTYPGEINRIGNTIREYEEQIDLALAEGWSIENSRKSFRWYSFLFSRVAVDFSDAVSSRPLAVRPKKPGLRLWAWKKLVYLLLQYGPTIRERLALRGRGLSELSQAVLLDVVINDLKSASDSTKWKAIDSTVENETQLIEQYLRGICSTLWRDIEAPNSLAGRVRANLRA
ncbi:MAG TPA: hypothetical protein PJ998_04625 [Terrimesophilobacter sp.]|nr:hypothetical protein [Terrimesophilobacter sp.]